MENRVGDALWGAKGSDLSGLRSTGGAQAMVNSGRLDPAGQRSTGKEEESGAVAPPRDGYSEAAVRPCPVDQTAKVSDEALDLSFRNIWRRHVPS